MEILCSVLVGAAAGGMAVLVSKPGEFRLTASLEVGILGGLLGLAFDFWLTTGGFAQLAFSELIPSGAGAVLALLLWIIAQRLFLNDAPERVISD